MNSLLLRASAGRGPVSLDLTRQNLAAQSAGAVHKWRLLDRLATARRAFDLSERAVSALRALLAFHPETALDPDGPHIVFPSQRALSRRANGMPESTLRRHLARLVAAGLLARRDSPNRKRFAVRARSGQVEDAYGFDLSPFVAAAARIEGEACAIEEADRALRTARRRASLLRRDCEAALEAQRLGGAPQGILDDLAARLAAVGPAPRRAGLTQLQTIAAHIEEIARTLDRLACERSADHEDDALPAPPVPADEAAQFERRIEIPFQSASRSESAADAIKPERAWPVAAMRSAFPGVGDYACRPIETWAAFDEATQTVQRVLRIPPDAWRAARAAMGNRDAAIAIAAIHERAGEIRAPAAYLRALTEQAQQGRFAAAALVLAGLRRSASAAATAARS